MAGLTQAAALLAGVVCLLALVADAQRFTVDGQVFCDPCRVNFITKLSEPMAGATVRLNCKRLKDQTVTFTTEGITNERGVYNLAAEGNHEDEACGVTLVKSSRPDCSEILDGGWAKDTADVSLDTNSGQHDDTRHANALSFTKKAADAQCAGFLKTIMADADSDN